ncbi:hypothetical protein ACHAXM_006758 [Skeletonema potamos]
MAENIIERLVKALTNDVPYQEQSLRLWNDDLETEMLSGGGSQFVTTKDDSSENFSTLSNAAHILHASLLTAVSPSYVCEDGLSLSDALLKNSNEEADDTSAKVAKYYQLNDKNQNLSCLSENLRAAGLFMRWYAQCLQSSLECGSASSTKNPTLRLKSKGMLLLYCKLLDDTNLQSCHDCPDIPRFASVCIFRATYGNDNVTSSARKSLIHSIDGCTFMMRMLLKGDQPVPRLFSIMRNVHHLISASPDSIPKMEKILETLTAEECSFGTENDYGKKKYGLLEVLVATLAWTLRSEPPFPGEPADRRSDLALEILRSLFAMDAGKTSMPLPSSDTMTQIGMMLCEILRLSNADIRVYHCKLAVVALLLNAPKEFSGYLASHDGIKPLVDILAYQLSVVVVERTATSAEDAAAVVPILLVLCKLCQSNAAVMQMVKNEVFPHELEDNFREKVTAEMAKMQTEGQSKAKNMAPLDAPKGTVRWKLIRLMTWIDSSVKRSACELLWTLCDEDATEFVLRTGFGNAVYFLGNKGLVNLPAGVSV